MVQIRPDDAWQDVYSFDLTPVIQADIDYGNHFTSTHPSSIFTKWRIAVLGHDDGQTVIFNDSCTVRRGTEEKKQNLPDDERYLQILRDQAGIDATGQDKVTVPVPDHPGSHPDGMIAGSAGPLGRKNRSGKSQ